AHQGSAGYAGRKSEIILDARGSAGLAAECAAIEGQHAQPLRSGVHGRGETCGPSPYDHDVEPLVRIDRAHHSDTTRQLALAWVGQELTAGAQHDREILEIDIVTLDDAVPAFVRFVQHLVRMTVADQESFQPHDVGVVRRSNDYRPNPLFHEADAAKDQR